MKKKLFFCVCVVNLVSAREVIKWWQGDLEVLVTVGFKFLRCIIGYIIKKSRCEILCV